MPLASTACALFHVPAGGMLVTLESAYQKAPESPSAQQVGSSVETSVIADDRSRLRWSCSARRRRKG